MNIKNFIASFNNYPILFIGTGISLRYLNHNYTWENLLKKSCFDLFGNNNYYLEQNNKYINENNNNKYAKIASNIEKKFDTKQAIKKFPEIDKLFYKSIENNSNNTEISRFKLYLASLFKDVNIRENQQITDELNLFKNASINIGSILTTNYDTFIEDNLKEFSPLIGNDIILANPYESVYKIHGSVTHPEEIIVTENDYKKFDKTYEILKAQILSLFISNPVIFLGYSLDDTNIKSILKTIFTAVPFSSEYQQKIKHNFLLVQRDKNSKNHEISDYSIVLDETITVQISRVKTDDFSEIYKSIADLSLPISIKKLKQMQNISHDFMTKIDTPYLQDIELFNKVENTPNNKAAVALGNHCDFYNVKNFIEQYFDIVDSKEEYLNLDNAIEKNTISSSQWFPIYGFMEKQGISSEKSKKLKKLGENQDNKLNEKLKKYNKNSLVEKNEKSYNTIASIENDNNICKTNKYKLIFVNVYNDIIKLDDLKNYLIEYSEKNKSYYKELLSLYDFKKYKNLTINN